MKTYFLTKLIDISNKIEKNTNSIVKNAQELDIKAIQDSTKRLNDNKDREKELINDAVIYCSVDDIIAISNEVDMIGDKKYKFNEHTLAYAYKYTSKGVTSLERDRLVDRFGYQLKDIKIK